MRTLVNGKRMRRAVLLAASGKRARVEGGLCTHSDNHRSLAVFGTLTYARVGTYNSKLVQKYNTLLCNIYSLDPYVDIPYSNYR